MTESALPDVINLQRKVSIDVKSIRSFVENVQSTVPEGQKRRFAVAFVGDKRMRELNSTFRGKDTTTDVLSFSSEPEPFETGTDQLGDIVISAEQAARQAEENGLSLESEIKQLVLHGVLHLCGYDHETDTGQMDKREIELREQLGIDR